MFSSIATTILLLYILSCIVALRRNLALARSSGLKCIIVPFHLTSIPWIMAQPLMLPLLSKLTKTWTSPWLYFLSIDQCWSHGHDSFDSVGEDTFIAVSAWGNILHTCDPEVCEQLFRANNFEKPAKLLAPLNLYGPTITATEHRETRLYRKTMAPFFNEQTMESVWRLALGDAKSLGQVFAGNIRSEVQQQLRPTLAKMSLHVVNTVCFEAERDISAELEFRAPVESGYTLAYSNAMHTVMENLREIFTVPKLALRLFPRVLQAYSELDQYLEELMKNKQRQLGKSKQMTEFSLLDLLMGADPSKNPALESSAVKGNIFLIMFAGHEANSNTMTFLILLLALHPSIQRSLQSDIDALPDFAYYTDTYNTAMSSLPGAIINETLRLYTVIPFVGKATWSERQNINLLNNTHSVPPNTLILMHTNATHRNPRFWPEPTKEKRGHGGMPFPVAAFNPYHWLSEKGERSDFLNPKQGTYFPFSEGARGCLGKKFALVELCATVCQIFSEYTVELVVDGINESECIATEINKEQQKEKWRYAREKGVYEMSAGVEFNMSLRLTGEVPVRFVPRGRETFGDINETE